MVRLVDLVTQELMLNHEKYGFDKVTKITLARNNDVYIDGSTVIAGVTEDELKLCEDKIGSTFEKRFNCTTKVYIRPTPVNSAISVHLIPRKSPRKRGS